jgi:hypothetical protein
LILETNFISGFVFLAIAPYRDVTATLASVVAQSNSKESNPSDSNKTTASKLPAKMPRNIKETGGIGATDKWTCKCYFEC